MPALPPLASLVKIILALAAAVAGGFAASKAGLPLAWVLGPLAITAAASIAGVPVFAPRRGRQIGQLLVGCTIGLNVTAATVGLVFQWFPAMLTTAIVAMLGTVVLSVPFARASRIDTTTAFFAMTPGGLAEMANVGQSVGAQPEPITLSQAIRVALLVCVMPPLILAFGADGGVSALVRGDTLRPQDLALLLGGALGGIALLKLLRANNAWMVGALVGSGTLAALGYLDGRMPAALFAAGQFLIGIVIGARFKRESLVRLPRVCIMAVLFVALLTLMLFGYAVILTKVTGIDLSSTALASSPGGLAEMALTAQVLHLNVALITAFHVVRTFIVNSFTLQVFNFVRRLGLIRGMEALMDRISRT